MASKVSVGKTAPVPLGQQKAANSLPVVFAEDQSPIPVEEQNKVQSEVALSLLGIPRAEVALGIFADVNTYDVNPTEWAQYPLENETDPSNDEDVINGVLHVPTEAGAELVASDTRTTILTSKRFFRYQPGRVSASTMGVKMSVTADPEEVQSGGDTMKGAPSIKKWGIFDKFDGYYFEIVNAGKGNDFRCVRRTGAIIPSQPAGYTNNLAWFNSFQQSDAKKFSPSTNFGVAGVDPIIIRDGLVYTAAAIYDPSLCYNPADVNVIDHPDGDPYGKLKDYPFDSGFGLRLATYNGSVWSENMSGRKFQFPFDQSKTEVIRNTPEDFRDYIRLDAHCNFFAAIANLNRKGSVADIPESLSALQTSTLFGSTIESSYDNHDGILTTHGWDPAPSTTNKNSKVWHLLCNTLGTAGGYRITTQDLTDNAVVPNRSVSNGNVTLKEWFNLCVPKPYRLVYEWRPCRAMFSGDKLDGATSVVRWSDVNTSAEDTISASDSGVINLPGDVILTPDLEDLTTTSVYEVDFTKVTMWKTEFSWYGAVGATFLCYVPVGNNEARWVRVHHIRASNQHSVASLGNAFLPITYLSHGGLSSGLDSNGGGTGRGNTLVKYGASYYIDGGDKGTVKLLSKSSDFQRSIPQGTYTFTPGPGNFTTSGSDLTYTLASNPKLPADRAVGLMEAYIEGDTTNKVKWISSPSGTQVTLHFTSATPNDASSVTIVIPRAQKSLLTLRTKDFISNRDGKAVRNRLQIYPIKLGAGVSGCGNGDILSVKSFKNPLLIVSNAPGVAGSDLASTGVVRDPATPANLFVNTKRSVLPVKVDFSVAISATVGDYRYGYFLATTDEGSAASPNTTSFFPVLGKLERKSDGFYFSKYSSYPENIYIAGQFLFERNLTLNDWGASTAIFQEKDLTAGAGLINTSASTDQTKWDKIQEDGLATFEDITRLSGVRVSQDLKLTPIPATGNEICSFYVDNGGYQFDLQDFFSYNKEYLSFPLTDEVDIISVFGHFDIRASANTVKINTSVSWEEQ